MNVALCVKSEYSRICNALLLVVKNPSCFLLSYLIYQRFEQGIKAQIGGNLSALREQQNSISEKLEEIQDKCDEDDALTVK